LAKKAQLEILGNNFFQVIIHKYCAEVKHETGIQRGEGDGRWPFWDVATKKTKIRESTAEVRPEEQTTPPITSGGDAGGGSPRRGKDKRGPGDDGGSGGGGGDDDGDATSSGNGHPARWVVPKEGHEK
jgi:hypothetical protein